MNAIAMPWLPPPREGEVDAAVAFLVGQWLADWLHSPPRADVEAIAAPADGLSGWQGLCGAWWQADLSDLLALGNAACADRADVTNPLDEQVLRGVAGAMMDDVLARLSGAGGRPEFFGVVAIAGERRVRLAIDAAGIVHARKAAAGSRRQPAVLPLATAVASEDVELGCHLGATSLTVAEIAALGIGDVVVLDRGLHAPVPLTIAGEVPQAGAARIGSDAGKIQVTVTEPPTLLRKS